jgi:AcrR family transcriptional regulator
MDRPARRGRPARLSRDQVVAAAVGLVVDGSGEPFSIHRLARALEVTPMAIYRHVGNKDELMQAVAQQLMADFRPQIPEAEWPEQLRAWAFAARDHFLGRPALFGILGWKEHIAAAWLQQIAVLARIIAGTGMENRELADAVQWAANTVIGHIYLEVSGRQSGYRINAGDMSMLSLEDALLVKGIMKHLGRKKADTVFSDTVERAIESLRWRLALPGSAEAAPAGR